MFRRVQRLAYSIAEAVAAELRPGTTEREAARAMRVRAREHGVRDWFHLPFAWFGDRTAFAGFQVPLQFFPTDRRLEAGMPFILDMAPVYEGCTADIGYSGTLGLNPLQERLMADLREHRELILREVRERRPLRQIYEDVDRLMSRQGYANRHRAYPFGVIAHKVDRVGERRWSPRVVRVRHTGAQGARVRRAARPPRGLVPAVEPVPVVRPSAAARPVGGRTAPGIPRHGREVRGDPRGHR